MLGSLILYNKGMRIIMFPLSGFYCITKIQVARRALIIMMILITITQNTSSKNKSKMLKSGRATPGSELINQNFIS